MFFQKSKIFLSEFKNMPMIRSMLILVTGTGVAQIFPLLSAPIITRLYDPEHFGVYAIFYSLVTLITGVAFLDFHNIIIVAQNDQKAYQGVVLSTIVSFSINFLIFVIVIFLPNQFLTLLFGESVVPFLWIVPITVFFNTLGVVFYTWFLRKECYKLLSKNKIILASCAILLQIGIGLLGVGVIGFILANLISILISFLLLLYNFKTDKSFISDPISFKSISAIAIEYKKFALVSVWANSLNIFTLQIPQFLLNKVFGDYVLGQYSLAQRIISLPLSFVSTAIQDVFRQGAAKEEIDNGNCANTYLNTFKVSSFIAILLFISCLTFIPPLFIFIFGVKWADAGIYVKVLSMLFAVRFVAAPLSYTLYIKAKQHLDFIWQVGLFLISIVTLFGGYYWLSIKDPIQLLLLYSICLSFWYFINMWMTFKLSK